MSVESLRSEIDFALSNTGEPWEASLALITDFLRLLHELMVKSSDDQLNLLAQVQAVFGSTPMFHLARTLDAPVKALKQYQQADDVPLYGQTNLICRQRGFDPADGRNLLAHFLKALDEKRTDKVGNVESAPVMVYWAVGHEAAYHLGGLYTGDLADVHATELCGYLDPTLKRFRKLVEMWHEEERQSREASE